MPYVSAMTCEKCGRVSTVWNSMLGPSSKCDQCVLLSRYDKVAAIAWLGWLTVVAMLALCNGCDSQPIPFGDGGIDVSVQDDSLGTNADASSTHDGVLLDSIQLESAMGDVGEDTKSDKFQPNQACPLPPTDCKLAINSNAQTICVSPQQGPYNSYFVCDLGKQYCCVPRPNQNACAYVTCVLI